MPTRHESTLTICSHSLRLLSSCRCSMSGFLRSQHMVLLPHTHARRWLMRRWPSRVDALL